jgi:hypothetical protein
MQTVIRECFLIDPLLRKKAAAPKLPSSSN